MKQYRQLLRTGSPKRQTYHEYSSDQRELEAVIVKKVGDVGCWEWQGGKSGDYGTMRRIAGPRDPVHRISYEIFKGEIPDDLVIDHLCANKLCCNPDHLQAVSDAENSRRGGETHFEQLQLFDPAAMPD